MGNGKSLKMGNFPFPFNGNFLDLWEWIEPNILKWGRSSIDRICQVVIFSTSVPTSAVHDTCTPAGIAGDFTAL